MPAVPFGNRDLHDLGWGSPSTFDEVLPISQGTTIGRFVERVTPALCDEDVFGITLVFLAPGAPPEAVFFARLSSLPPVNLFSRHFQILNPSANELWNAANVLEFSSESN
jgi:hypothetical protein